jgi:hypothetical protein
VPQCEAEREEVLMGSTTNNLVDDLIAVNGAMLEEDSMLVLKYPTNVGALLTTVEK